MAEASKSGHSSAPPPASRRGRFWLLLLVLPLVEVVGHFVVQARVPTDDEWAQAAAFVTSELDEDDNVVVAPDWADPLLRLHMGDALDARRVGYADFAPFDRVWMLSIRGHRHPELAEYVPAFERAFGRVRVLRYDFGPSSVEFDLTRRIRTATVVYQQGGRNRACPWRSQPRNHGGGLSQGPLFPEDRFQCDTRRRWLFVGPTVNEDLELRPRACIWQHPQGNEPVRTTFHDVPLGDRIVLYGSLYYEHERKLEHGEVTLRVLVDGVEVGRLVHRDGDGHKRLEALTRAPGSTEPATGDVAIEVTADNPHLRTICWSATTRGPQREFGE